MTSPGAKFRNFPFRIHDFTDSAIQPLHTSPPVFNLYDTSTLHQNTANMPRRKFIDTKNATTFSLVHRAQNDPLIHDENAPSMVFTEKQSKYDRRPTEDDYAYSSAGSVFSDSSRSEYRSSKVRQRGDLEDEFGLAFKKNEGEAAQHGVFFDDTEYDYMQHMRDLGTGEGPVAWVEASAPPQRQKKKQKLEDALRTMDLGDDTRSIGTSSSAARSLLSEEILPGEFVTKRTYQDQQDIPDEIAGFQPDMDPELREALMALEDEEFVDDADEDDTFGQLIVDGYEIDKDYFERIGEQGFFDEDGDGALPKEDDGWESDDTIRAHTPPPPPTTLSEDSTSLPKEELVAKLPTDTQAQPPADPTEGAWLDEYQKFKQSTRASPIAPAGAPAATSSLTSGPRDAKTILSSISTARSEQQQLLDARFERLMEREYSEANIPDDVSSAAPSLVSGMSGVSGMSKASATSSMISGQGGVRSDFDSIVDEFLDTHTRVGKHGRRVKRMKAQTGMEQLDEIRSGLGPARIKGKAGG